MRSLRAIRSNSDFKTIQKWLIGRYNNEKQVLDNKAIKRYSRDDGGHELINAIINLHPNETDVLVAAFYSFNGTKPYRYRYYECCEDPTNRYSCLMKLYKPTPQSLPKLIASNYSTECSLPPLNEFELLSGCDVGWTRRKFFGFIKRQSFLGELVKGECIVFSERDPSVQLLIRDELRLWKDSLWINDQVRNLKGELLIGNKLGIHYKLLKSA